MTLLFQVKQLQTRFNRYPGMTIDTVERFQGSERRVMIMTTVRTDQIGFLNEYRVCHLFTLSFKNDAILIFQRFNTAITRAKHMLIVIGDPYLLSRDSTWNEYVYFICLTY